MLTDRYGFLCCKLMRTIMLFCVSLLVCGLGHASGNVIQMLDSYEASIKDHLQYLGHQSIDEMLIDASEAKKISRQFDLILGELPIKKRILDTISIQRLRYFQKNRQKQQTISQFHLDGLPDNSTLKKTIGQTSFPRLNESHGKFIAKRVLKRLDVSNAIARKAELLVFLALNQVHAEQVGPATEEAISYKNMIKRSIATKLPSINAAKASQAYPFIRDTELKAAFALIESENQQAILNAFQDEQFMGTYIEMAESVNSALDDFLKQW